MKNKKSELFQFIAVDAGNTSVLFGYFEGRSIKKIKRILTKDVKEKYSKFLKKNFNLKKVEAVVIGSVVPSLGNFLRQRIPKDLKIKSYLLEKEIPVPIKNHYKKPKQVGVDRLLSALGALKKYSRDLIVIDFGTAITLDAVSKQKGYLGGAIAPGIEISLEALFERTALLPKTGPAHPGGFIGKDTIESIRVGSSFGLGGLCDRLVEGLSTHFKKRPLVIGTGGYARFMKRYCKRMDRIEPNLVLEGILEAYSSYKRPVQKKSKKILTKNSAFIQ